MKKDTRRNIDPGSPGNGEVVEDGPDRALGLTEEAVRHDETSAGALEASASAGCADWQPKAHVSAFPEIYKM